MPHKGETLHQSSTNLTEVTVLGTMTLPVDMTEAEVNALFASCLPKLKKAARRMLRNQQDCEDALQDGLLLAYRNLRQFEGRSSFSTWLHTIVANCSRMYYRKAVARRLSFVDWGTPEQDALLERIGCVETRPSPEEMCIQGERSDILRRTTQELPAKYHRAIECFHLQGLGEEETARRLHMTTSAVKSQLHRSRRLLTSRIRRSYVSAGFKGSLFYRKVPRRNSTNCTVPSSDFPTARASAISSMETTAR